MRKYFIYLLLLSCPTFLSASNLEIEKLMPAFKTFMQKQLIGNKQGKDVHSFNASFKAHKALIQTCNKVYELQSEGTSLQLLEKFSLWRKEFDLSPNFDANILKLRLYIQAGENLDKETGLSANELLSATCGHIDPLDKTGKSIALSEFFYYLNQNSTENGGCFAGYVGRLALINAKIIMETYQNKLTN